MRITVRRPEGDELDVLQGTADGRPLVVKICPVVKHESHSRESKQVTDRNGILIVEGAISPGLMGRRLRAGRKHQSGYFWKEAESSNRKIFAAGTISPGRSRGKGLGALSYPS